MKDVSLEASCWRMHLIQPSMELEYCTLLDGGCYPKLRTQVNDMGGFDYNGGTLGELCQGLDQLEQGLYERLKDSSVDIKRSWILDCRMFRWKVPDDAGI